MTMLERAQKMQRGRQGPNCSVGTTLGGLQPKYRAEVQEAMADPTIFSTIIEQLLEEDGISVGATAIQRHRRGKCMCGKGA